MEGHVNTMRAVAPFAALEPSSAERCLRDLSWEERGEGHAFERLDTGELLLLAEGEVEVRVDGRILEFRSAPAVVLARDPMQVVAKSRVLVARARVAEIVAHDSDARDALCRVYERELERLEHWRADELRKGDDFFVDDGGADLVPGPYRFGPYQATAILMDADPGALRHELPPGLSPVPGIAGRYLLVLSEIERCVADHPDSDGRDHRYLEVAAFVPCLGPRMVPGLYLPRVYPDAYLPILLGREAYGFAKRLGRIVREERGYDLIAGGRHVVRARWSDGTEPRGTSRWMDDLTAVARSLMRVGRPRLYLRKRILGVRAGPKAQPCVDQLVVLPFRVQALDTVRVLAAPTVTFPESGWGLGGRAIGAARFNLGFDFADGRVVRDYRVRGRAR